MLQDEAGEEIYQLWLEFETKKTYEAKVANALDKLEVQIQHLEADIRTWKDIEYEMCFMLEKHTSFSAVLSELKKKPYRTRSQKENIASKRTVFNIGLMFRWKIVTISNYINEAFYVNTNSVEIERHLQIR